MSAASLRPSARALWRYCVSIYRRPGIRAECLTLQRRYGVNVNLLLVAAYLGAELGVVLSGREVAAADRSVARWHLEVVAPLRALRRRLARSRAAQALLRPLLTVELAAERIEVTTLAAWCRTRRRARHAGARAATVGNLERVLSRAAGRAASAPRRLLAAALARRRPRTLRR